MKTLSIDVRRADLAGRPSHLGGTPGRAGCRPMRGLIPHKPLIADAGAPWRETGGARQRAGRQRFWCSTSAGEIAGYATVGLNRARAPPYDGEIYEIYLRPEYPGHRARPAAASCESRTLLNSLGCRRPGTFWCSWKRASMRSRFFRRHGGADDAVEGMEDFRRYRS